MTASTIKNIAIYLTLFLYSMLLIVPYIGGDQEHYRIFYDEARDVALFDALKMGVAYLGAYEPLSLSIYWFGSVMGVNKDIYVSILNTALLVLTIRFLVKKETNASLIFLFLTNYYIIVLMTGAERLKISYIFLLLFAVYGARSRVMFLFLAFTSHFQSLILLASHLFSLMDRPIKNLIYQFSISKSFLLVFCFVSVFSAIFGFVFHDGLYSKFISYAGADFEIGELIPLLALAAAGFLLVKNKIRLVLLTIILSAFVALLGGSRVNMIAVTAFMYLIILEKKQNHPLVYLLMIYFSLKSVPFVFQIYRNGNGFSSG